MPFARKWRSVAFRHDRPRHTATACLRAGERLSRHDRAGRKQTRGADPDRHAAHCHRSAPEIDDRQAGTIAELIDSVPGVALVNGSTLRARGSTFAALSANGTVRHRPEGCDNWSTARTVGSEEDLTASGNAALHRPLPLREVRGHQGRWDRRGRYRDRRRVVRLETKDASDFTGGEPGFAFRPDLRMRGRTEADSHRPRSLPAADGAGGIPANTAPRQERRPRRGRQIGNLRLNTCRPGSRSRGCAFNTPIRSNFLQRDHRGRAPTCPRHVHRTTDIFATWTAISSPRQRR